jgi:hypothetical protein
VGFNKGQGGRPKGALNKSTMEFKAAIIKSKHPPAQALIDCYNNAMAEYAHYSTLLRENRISGMEDNGWRYLKIAADMAEKIASYLYPKRKAVDMVIQAPQVQSRPLEYLSDEELDSL